MEALLVWPEFPPTYWSYSYSLRLVGKRCLLPPLPLITVAAMLPDSWKLRLVDLNAERLSDEQIRGADVVLISGMLAQRKSMHQLVERCRALGVRCAVGGPYATAVPEDFAAADHVFVGEAEGSIGEFCRLLERGRAPHRFDGCDKPPITDSPVPRYDLLDVRHYLHMALQYSRGCPFSCEFCDIIVMYGRKPRVKTPEQVQRELDAIARTGFRGSVFFVDDNFIGNKKEVRALIPHLQSWQEANDWPFFFYTEASLNLADDEPLMKSMVEAGFESVFIGIESPSADSIAEMHKVQNMKGDITGRVHRIIEHGMDVWAGFIIGFDSDTPSIFDEQYDLIEQAAIPFAMVGVLQALPGTALTRRLEKEGRLKPHIGTDQFGYVNFETVLPEKTLVAGYRRLLRKIYDPRAYLDRVRAMLARRPQPRWRARPTAGQIVSGIRALITQGLIAHYRFEYLRFLWKVWRWDSSRLVEALMRAGAGHHFIEYTRKVVAPRLEAMLDARPLPALGGSSRGRVVCPDESP
ncbi:MAG TPA: DUF4070 domain-containing protein [Acidobacteria bacterium]|nr:DUF4070 domain-containing protein [Acidobacteriota bacterium]